MRFFQILFTMFILTSCQTSEPLPLEEIPTLAPKCKTTVMRMPLGYYPNDFDNLTKERAKIRCRAHFPDAPCLVVFYILGNMNYHAVCGAELL